MTEKVILGAVDKCLEGIAVTRHGQHGSRRGKLRLTGLISCYGKFTRLMDAGKAGGCLFSGF